MTEEREVRRAFLVRGRVQGVGFRWWTRRAAEELGVRGTVKNLADGSVEIHAAGSAEALKLFQERLSGGPTPARIDSIEALDTAGRIPESGFRIVF